MRAIVQKPRRLRTSADLPAMRQAADQPHGWACTATRFFMGAVGSSLVGWGLRRRSHLGMLAALAGGAAVLRAAHGPFDVLSPRRGGVRARHGVHFETAITVQQSPEKLYEFWRNLNNLPRVMMHLREVEVREDGRSHWIADAPLGMPIAWDAEIINERANELIAWKSLPGSMLATAGSVHFRARGHDRGTMVTVSLKYEPPAGKLGATLARWLGSGLEHQLTEDLRRFKQQFEAGEAPTIEGQPQGACSAQACCHGGSR